SGVSQRHYAIAITPSGASFPRNNYVVNTPLDSPRNVRDSKHRGAVQFAGKRCTERCVDTPNGHCWRSGSIDRGLFNGCARVVMASRAPERDLAMAPSSIWSSGPRVLPGAAKDDESEWLKELAGGGSRDAKCGHG